MSFISRVSETHTYRANAEINFYLDEKEALTVTIDTERLHARSVEAIEDECNAYASLFGDPQVMEKFATGQTKTKEDMQKRINDLWAKRWKENDPYSGLSVYKNDTDEFLGHVVIGHSGNPGQSELAYLFMKAHWGKGFGSEAVASVVREYAPATVKEGYLLDGKPLEKITATSRPDNPASVRIQEKVGMRKIGEEEKYGALRYHFLLELKDLKA